MDIRKVKKLIELMESSDITEIEIMEGEESVRIARYPGYSGQPVVQTAPASVQAPEASPAPDQTEPAH